MSFPCVNCNARGWIYTFTRQGTKIIVSCPTCKGAGKR